MIIERRQTPRTTRTCLITTPVAKPACTIVRGIMPPATQDGKPRKGIFFAFSPLTRRVALGVDYIDAFTKFHDITP